HERSVGLPHDCAPSRGEVETGKFYNWEVVGIVQVLAAGFSPERHAVVVRRASARICKRFRTGVHD
ncbi:MAG TPA: hypothetical protein VE505_19220, partial [Vicinamibacterales bacterium]|nr:hypothetical protein [Vicinamibacterales bacterium]